MSISLRVGSRLPLYCTSMGQVLLGGCSRAAQDAYLRRTDLAQRTPNTKTEPGDLLEIFARVAEEGHAIVDQQLEIGLRSIAVPVMGRNGVLAALNVGTQAARVAETELRTRYLPALRRVARDLQALGLG